MNVAIIGAGNIGTGFARRLLGTAYGIVLTCTDPAKAAGAALDIGGGGGRVQSAPLDAALAQAKIVVLAVPFAAVEAIAASAAARLAGKVVVDVTNPLTPDFAGLTLGFDGSAGERVAALLPGARVVKGFNTISRRSTTTRAAAPSATDARRPSSRPTTRTRNPPSPRSPRRWATRRWMPARSGTRASSSRSRR